MNIQEIGFGDFCTIEQKRYVGPNEFYSYKVVGRKKSNVWSDVPVDASNRKETLHDYMDDVVTVVCNNLDDRTVYQFRVSDLASVRKAQAVPEWISVEDKLPTENENYLVCIDGDVFYLTAKWVKNHFKFLARGYGLTEDFTDWRYCEGVKVTHWMLLPDAPQEPTND